MDGLIESVLCCSQCEFKDNQKRTSEMNASGVLIPETPKQEWMLCHARDIDEGGQVKIQHSLQATNHISTA